MRTATSISSVVTCALLVTSAFGPSPSAAADGDRYLEHASITYQLDRKGKEVDVRASFTVTNRVPSTRTTRYYADRWNWIYVPNYAQDFRISRGATAHLVKKDAEWRYYEIAFARIFYGQRASFTASWTLPSRGAKSTNPTRVTDAYSHFCWYGQSVDTGSVSAILPRRVDVETSGSGVGTRKGKVTTLTGRLHSDLDNFGACTDVYDERLLVQRKLTSPAGHQVVISAWPDDTDWLDRAERNVAYALSLLEDIVGAPIPGDEPIVVREAAANALEGYAGDFDFDSSVVRLNETSTDTVTIAHEIAHSWFDHDSFASPWMYEGLAEWAARAATALPCTEPSDYPGKGSPKLRDWRYLGYKPSQTRQDLVDYQYEASCAIVLRVAWSMGADRMRDVLQVMFNGRSPYDRLTGLLPATPSPVAAASPPPLVGPGQSPSTTPLPQLVMEPSWSPTASGPRRKNAVDWRQWLDIVDEIGIAPTRVAQQVPAQLLMDHGIATQKQLRGRADVRAAYHALQAMTPVGITPAIVRRLMDDWRFEDAELSIELATEVATRLLESPLAGHDALAAPWIAFEAAKRTQDLRRVAQLVE